MLEVQAQLAVLTGRYDQARTALARTRRMTGAQAEFQFHSPLTFIAAELARVDGDMTGALDMLRPVLRDGDVDVWTARYNWPLTCQASRPGRPRDPGAGPPHPGRTAR